MTFGGFSEDTTEFFIDLEKNNTKSWFEKNRERYEISVLNPVKEFILEIGNKLQLISKVTYDTRTNGQGSILRINRDLRFSQDKTPYNIYLSALLWEGSGKKNLSPAFGFRIGQNGMELMAGMYMFDKDQLTVFRGAVLDEKIGGKLQEILDKLNKKGLSIGGVALKKIPKGYDPDHPRAHLLKHKGLYVHPKPIPSNLLISETIVDQVLEKFHTMAPIQQWLVSIMN